MDFSAHFLLLGGRPARHGALGDDFSGGADDLVPLWTRLRRRRSVARTGMRKCRARGQDVSGMAPPSRMMRAQRSRIAANMSNMAALIFKNTAAGHGGRSCPPSETAASARSALANAPILCRAPRSESRDSQDADGKEYGIDESPGGVSPPGAPKTVREP